MDTKCTQNMTLGRCIKKSAFGRYKNNKKTVNAVFMDTKCTQNMAQGRHVARSENLGGELYVGAMNLEGGGRAVRAGTKSGGRTLPLPPPPLQHACKVSVFKNLHPTDIRMISQSFLDRLE